MNTNNHRFLENPYTFGNPIHNREQLYGREDTIEQIENNFRNNQKITLLHVQRRIGKTSLIECLPQFITEKQGFKFVNVSLQGFKYKSISTILNDWANTIYEGISELPNEVIELANHPDYPEKFFVEFLPTIINKYLSDKRLVLLLDEFDVLEEDKEITKGKELFSMLENAVEQEEKLFAILVFGRPVTDMTYLKRFLEKQDPIEVGLLNRKDTEKLIVQPAQEVLKYEPGAINAIWQLSAGHPSLTQLICRNIFAYCRRKEIKQVISRHIELILDEAMQQGTYVFDGFLQPLNDSEKLFFRAVAEIQEIAIVDPLKIIKPTREIPKSALRQAGERLVEYDFLERKGAGYKIKVELVRLWLLKNHRLSDDERLQQNGNNNSQEPNPIYAFASLLLLFVVGIGFVAQSLSSLRRPSICNNLLQEIKIAIESGNSEERSKIIDKVRQEKSLDELCSNSNEIYRQFHQLLNLHGQEEIKDKKLDTGIQTLCSIPDKYAGITEIEKYITELISSLPREEKRKLINEIFKQNPPENKCPAYSLEDETNKKNLLQELEQIDKFYHQQGDYQKSEDGYYNYPEAVKSYCQISKNYSDLDKIKEELENLSIYAEEFGLTLEQEKQIINLLKKIGKKNCPAFPDI